MGKYDIETIAEETLQVLIQNYGITTHRSLIDWWVYIATNNINIELITTKNKRRACIIKQGARSYDIHTAWLHFMYRDGLNATSNS